MSITIIDVEVDVRSTVVAVVLAIGGCAAAARVPNPLVRRLAAAVAPVGALGVAMKVRGVDWWPARHSSAALLVGGVLACVVLLAPSGTRLARAIPLLCVVSAAGAFLTTPDTERAVLLVFVTLTTAACGAPLPIDVGRGLAGGTVGAIGWVAATDGHARPGAVVGALCCTAMLPLLAWCRASALRVTVAHTGAVIIAARVAGFRASAVESAEIAAVALVVAFAASAGFIEMKAR